MNGVPFWLILGLILVFLLYGSFIILPLLVFFSSFSLYFTFYFRVSRVVYEYKEK